MGRSEHENPASSGGAQPDARRGGEPADCLCPRSSEAMESFVAAGFDASRVPPEHKARCEKVRDLLSLLSRCEHGSSAEKLSARTVARIRAAERVRADTGRFELCEDDAEALELLVTERFDSRRVTSAMRARAEAIGSLLENLEQAGPEISAVSRDELVTRTLAMVQSQETLSASRMRIHEASERSTRGVRLIDVGAVAATLAVGGALLWPTVSSMRQRSMQVAGASRMGSVGAAVGQYSLDSRGSLPLASASLAGSTWWNVGRPQESNSANLFTLRRTGYATLDQLSSPGNAAAKGLRLSEDAWDWENLEQVSYSYQNQFAAQRACMNDRGMGFVVLADKSPVALRAWRGERVVYYNENSPNFEGRGQNVLRSDGTVAWHETPFVKRGEGGIADNLWLPASIEKLVNCVERRARGETHCEALRGIEQPSAKDDAFLCP